MVRYVNWWWISVSPQAQTRKALKPTFAHLPLVSMNNSSYVGNTLLRHHDIWTIAKRSARPETLDLHNGRLLNCGHVLKVGYTHLKKISSAYTLHYFSDGGINKMKKLLSKNFCPLVFRELTLSWCLPFREGGKGCDYLHNIGNGAADYWCLYHERAGSSSIYNPNEQELRIGDNLYEPKFKTGTSTPIDRPTRQGTLGDP